MGFDSILKIIISTITIYYNNYKKQKQKRTSANPIRAPELTAM